MPKRRMLLEPRKIRGVSDAFQIEYSHRGQTDIAKWAKANIRLTTRQPTAYPGPYDISITPYLQGYFDALADPGISHISIQKGAQTGLSLAAHVALMHWICCDPGPCLYVMPSDVLAKSLSETRIQPMIEDSPIVYAELLPEISDFKRNEYHLKGMQVNFVGANSAANLASRPVRYLILDELDKFPRSLGAETSARSLALQRTKSFWNRKVIEFTTPTDNVTTQIQGVVVDGDQRKYFVPCLKCNHSHELAWKNVKFDSKVSSREVGATTRYVCPKCGAEMSSADKDEMVRRGKWEATAAGEPGHASFYIPSILSPWISLEYLASKWIAAQRDQGDLQDFINSELGEVWSIISKTTDEKAIVRRRQKYRRNEKPFEVMPEFAEIKDETARFLTVDVQKSCFWWVLRDWRRGGLSAMVDFGRADMWSDIVKLADTNSVLQVFVDSGYGVRTSEVYEMCLAHKFIPTKGASRAMSMPWMQQSINIYEGTRKQRDGESIQLVIFDTNQLKGKLMDMIEGSGWFLPNDISLDYIRQLSSEEMIADKWVLKRGHKDNHLLDCEVLQVLGAQIFGYVTTIQEATDEPEADKPDSNAGNTDT